MSALNHLHQPRVGFGCMNVSHAYSQPLSKSAAITLMRQAFEQGYRHFDTATLYGGGDNERIVGEALAPFRREICLASKCGLYIDPDTGKNKIDGRPATLRAQCEASLKRLNVEHIDLYYLHRLDHKVPVEESVGMLGDLVSDGKIGAVGLSEVSAATLRRAQREHPITALQSEYSLWSRNVEIAALEACRELGVTFVAFSPLARGFLSNAVQHVESLDETDIRRQMPRFQSPNLEHNLEWLADYLQMAKQYGLTPAQLAIAWVNSQAEHIVALPGTRLAEKAADNLSAASLTLTKTQCAEVEAIVNRHTVKGKRYSDLQQRAIDTEQFADELNA